MFYLRFNMNLFFYKRQHRWCADTEYHLKTSTLVKGNVAPVDRIVKGVYRTKTTLGGEVISDNINYFMTHQHYVPVITKELEAEYEARRKAEHEAIVQRINSANNFADRAFDLLKSSKDGIIATIQNTFDNGYTSVWDYKVQDGKLIVQKPWGNQARAEFSDLDAIVDDFHRYLGYGFTIA